MLIQNSKQKLSIKQRKVINIIIISIFIIVSSSFYQIEKTTHLRGVFKGSYEGHFYALNIGKNAIKIENESRVRMFELKKSTQGTYFLSDNRKVFFKINKIHKKTILNLFFYESDNEESIDLIFLIDFVKIEKNR